MNSDRRGVITDLKELREKVRDLEQRVENEILRRQYQMRRMEAPAAETEKPS